MEKEYDKKEFKSLNKCTVGDEFKITSVPNEYKGNYGLNVIFDIETQNWEKPEQFAMSICKRNENGKPSVAYRILEEKLGETDKWEGKSVKVATRTLKNWNDKIINVLEPLI